MGIAVSICDSKVLVGAIRDDDAGTNSGSAYLFDAATGQPVYQQVRLPKGYSIKASPLAINGRLYFSTEDEDVVVAKAGPTLDIIATNTLKDQSFIASPAHSVRSSSCNRSRSNARVDASSSTTSTCTVTAALLARCP